MESNLIFVAFFCVVLCHVAWSGCVEVLQNDQQAMNCMTGYMTFAQQASQQGGNPAAMFCSEEGQAAMECVFELVARCPEFSQSQGFYSKKQIEQMCELTAGLGGMSKTCMDAQNCLASSGGESAFPTGFAAPRTKFTYVQQLMDPICGPFAVSFKCITPEVETECPSIVEAMRNITAMAQKVMPPDVKFPSYDILKKLAKESCPKLPKDFGTSWCVRDYLREQSYVDCISQVNKNYTTNKEKISCHAVDDRLDCLSDILVDNCGKEYYDGIVNHAHYFFTDQLLRCNPGGTDGPAGSAGVVKDDGPNGSAGFAKVSILASTLPLLLVIFA